MINFFFQFIADIVQFSKVLWPSQPFPHDWFDFIYRYIQGKTCFMRNKVHLKRCVNFLRGLLYLTFKTWSGLLNST